jgi:adenylate cyclase
MADIFISYSSIDKIQALELVGQLRGSGYDVWIDQSGIDAATSWSKEIAEALEDCATFILLLSSHSLASENVAKELAIAAELKKHIIPIELEAVQLKREFLYHLTGLQRVAHTNVDAIVHALEKLKGSADVLHTLQRVDLPSVIDAGLHRIAVLPFEDQSPEHDNEWFSDGLTDELISTLGKLDQLFVVDSQSSRIYKGVKLQTKDIAIQLGVRYIVRGAVRKAAEKIRIQATLIDTTTGATLWDEKFNGTMDDIFEIQEKTAIDITSGLKLKLTKEEVKEIEERGTDSPEAYELFLRARAVEGHSREDMGQSIELLQQAIALDPNFIAAYGVIAVQYANLYRNYGEKPEILQLQKAATEKAVALAPENTFTYTALANLYMNTGEQMKSIETAKKTISVAPRYPHGYSVLGFMYQASGNYAEAARCYEQALSLGSRSLRDHNNVMASYYLMGDKETLRKSVIRATPYFEQYLALRPDDQGIRCNFMTALESTDQHERSKHEGERLLAMTDVHGHTYWQIGGMYARGGEVAPAVECLKKAAKKGVADFNELRNDAEWFGCLQTLPNFEDFVSELEVLVSRSAG